MKKKLIYLVLLFFSAQFVFSQDEKLMSGKIIVKDATPMGVHVINLVNEKEAISDIKGYFSILAKPDDVLVFSSDHLDYQRKIVEEEDYNCLSLIVEMTSKANKLDEVEIVRLDAVKLGILSQPAKTYTPAERRLYGATSSPVDALLNVLSGRTEMLKQGVETEKKEFLLLRLDGLYKDSFYTDSLKIKKEDIKGFQYYLVEDSKFADVVNSKNKPLTTLMMIELAQKYKLLNKDEQK